MATAAFITPGQIPMMGGPQTTYEIDPITQQAYPAGLGNYVTSPGHLQQQVFLTSGQPVQVLGGPAGPMISSPLRFQNHAQSLYMQHPSQNIMHVPYAGDLQVHAPPAYTEIDNSRFSNSRARRSSFSMSLSGQYGYPNQGSQVGPSDYAYVENCAFCRANHPGPHPHGASMNMHDMSSMMGPRMTMDDSMSNSSRMRSSAYSYEGPMYDPFDHSPNFRSQRGRDDYRPKSHMRASSRGRSSSRPGRLPYGGNIVVSEISDHDDSEDEMGSKMGGHGRMTGYQGSVRRQSNPRIRSASASRNSNRHSGTWV